MPEKYRVTVRLDEQTIADLDAYAAECGQDRATVVRLAIVEQLRRKPPKKLPEGAKREPGNPQMAESAAELGKKGAAKRWGKPKT